MDNQSIQHTRWNCTYHIVFIPKYRRKIMYGENGDCLNSSLRIISDQIQKELRLGRRHIGDNP